MSPHHAQRGEPSEQEPEEVEEGVEVDVVGDEEDHTVAKQPVTLGTQSWTVRDAGVQPNISQQGAKHTQVMGLIGDRDREHPHWSKYTPIQYTVSHFG